LSFKIHGECVIRKGLSGGKIGIQKSLLQPCLIENIIIGNVAMVAITTGGPT
jgi:glutamate synthase domain-containing protein 3